MTKETSKEPWSDCSSLKVTIMGLGLHGGGLASCLFFAKRGAHITVTDLRNEQALAPSLEALKEWKNIRFVLGRHEKTSFTDADVVIKNPAVRKDNPFLALARRVETDLSIFLNCIDNPVLAITGTKGKSVTVRALSHILQTHHPGVREGGNIAISPLSFIDEISPDDPIVLELSSWQLADLKGKNILHPCCAAITNLLWDHMNVYKNLKEYAQDKLEIFIGQEAHHWSLCNWDQEWGRWFSKRTPGCVAGLGLESQPPKSLAARFWLERDKGQTRGFGEKGTELVELLPDTFQVPGQVFQGNCLTAAALAFLYGMNPTDIRRSLEKFRGLEHRMELCLSHAGVDYYNDTAATIPHAAVSSFESFYKPVHWITGGTDKNLDFTPYLRLTKQPKSLILLQGSATDRLIPVLQKKGLRWDGPYADFSQAVHLAISRTREGDIVLLSPGAASFEMFHNEFDRGQQFRNLVHELLKKTLCRSDS